MVALPLPKLPDEIADLRDLALDLRWTWSHEGDALWAHIDEHLWHRTRNPWLVLQSASAQQLDRLAADPVFREKLLQIKDARKQYVERSGWFSDSPWRQTVRRSRLSEHGIRSRRGFAALCRRTWRAGGRLSQDCQRSCRSGHRNRAALSGRIFSPDRRRRRAAAGIVSLQRTRRDADRTGDPSAGRLDASAARVAGPGDSASCLAGDSRAGEALSSG